MEIGQVKGFLYDYAYAWLTTHHTKTGRRTRRRTPHPSPAVAKSVSTPSAGGWSTDGASEPEGPPPWGARGRASVRAERSGAKRPERSETSGGAVAEVVAVSGAVGGGGPSLDLGKNNSTSPETPENGRYDCREVYSNFRFEQVDADRAGPDEDLPTVPYRCGSWDCYCCGYRMRMNLIEEIARVCRERPEMSRLLTLTLDPAKAPEGDEERHRYITERWNALRTRLRREVGDFSFIWVREEQESGLPHLHVIVSRFLPQSVVSASWADLGGGEVVDIRQVDRVEKAAHYVGKYLTKHAMAELPEGTRRYGSSRDITLAVRGGGEGGEESEGDWRLVLEDYGALDWREEPLTRSVEGWDFICQREWGGPVPPDLDVPPGVQPGG